MPKQTKSEYVTTVTLGDEEIEIRRLEGGPLIGLDGAYLHQLGDGEHPNNPYDEGIIIVPDDEEKPGGELEE